MTVKQILESGLVNDDTNILIHDEKIGMPTMGNWFQDNILHYVDYEIDRFSWQRKQDAMKEMIFIYVK